MNEFINERKEMETFLNRENLGYLCCSSNNEPYAVPINYAYDEGRIIVHCAHRGKKLDIIRENPRVCFVVGDQEGDIKPHEPRTGCHVPSQSVICHGRARIIKDLDERAKCLNLFLKRYRPDAPPLPTQDVKACACVVIHIEEMTGRKEKEGRDCTYWQWHFK